MNILRGFFGGLADGKPGAFSQLDGSNPLERFLMGVTGSPPVTAGVPALPGAPSAGGAGIPASAIAPPPSPNEPLTQAPMRAPVSGVPAQVRPKHSILDQFIYGNENLRKIDDEAAQKAQVQQAFGDDPQAVAIYGATGSQGLLAYLNDKRDHSKPTLYSTSDGIVSVSPKEGGGWNTENVFTPKPKDTRDIPMGMERDPATGKLKWQEGYLDSIGAASGVRRDAVISRPMPSHARPHAAPANTVKWD